jgi:hypothetical protein
MTMLLLLLLLAQSLTDAQITSAIERGQKDPKQHTAVQLGSDLTGQYILMMRGPSLRVTGASALAAQKYLPFTKEMVGPDLLMPVLEVQVIPGKPMYSPYSGWNHTPAVTHIVIKTKAGAVTQPLAVEPFPYAWTNGAGGKFEGQGATARFALESVPAGEFEVVVIGPTGPVYARTVKAKEREKLR